MKTKNSMRKISFMSIPHLFDIFTYKVLKGDVKSALREPNKIILTERIATRYFGKTDPIGKTLTTGTNTFEVTGVIQRCPIKFSFPV